MLWPITLGIFVCGAAAGALVTRIVDAGEIRLLRKSLESLSKSVNRIPPPNDDENQRLSA